MWRAAEVANGDLAVDLPAAKGQSLNQNKELITVTRSSKEYTQGDGLSRFDAQAWTLVHFLMFGQNAARLYGIEHLLAARAPA